MKKMITLFKRDFTKNPSAYDEVSEGAEWVIAGEGEATRKWDGTCCLVEGGVFYKRYEVKKGKTPAEAFKPASDADPVTGKQQGWVPVGEGPEDKYHREALGDMNPPDATYELCGPKVQGNPEGFDSHVLALHGAVLCMGLQRDFGGIKEFLGTYGIEGIVFHHPDGRMVKIKGTDFGIKRMKKGAVK